MSAKPLFGLKAAFVEIKHEENRKKVVMGTTPNLSKEIFALLTDKQTTQNHTLAASRRIPSNEGDKLFSRYYKKNGQRLEIT